MWLLKSQLELMNFPRCRDGAIVKESKVVATIVIAEETPAPESYAGLRDPQTDLITVGIAVDGALGLVEKWKRCRRKRQQCRPLALLKEQLHLLLRRPMDAVVG